ncbi:hypothetical protein SESBI_40305 [Sesbania bispinosa]|nr:hypothetical protein SESBI_40305 [Sesbania bispinosa]
MNVFAVTAKEISRNATVVAQTATSKGIGKLQNEDPESSKEDEGTEGSAADKESEDEVDKQ